MSDFSPFSKGGKCCPFFYFVFFASGSASFAVFCRFSFLRVGFLKKLSGANFCFWVWCWSCVFWWVFCLCLCFIFGDSLPKLFGKILLTSGLVFFGFVLSAFGFFVDVVFFFRRDTVQVVAGHPFTRTCFA